jgi:D-3-phosphoglycerate dehydrogenase
MFSILICDPISSSCIEALKNEGFSVIYKPEISKEDLLNEVGNKHALVVRGRTKVTSEIIDRAKELKIIVRAGVGLDNIDVDYAESKNIKVFNTPEAVTNAVAELTVCFILALLRDLIKANESLKRGEWIKNKLIGNELRNKTVGILGFGRIGFEVAKKLRAFDCKILAYSRKDKSELAKSIGAIFTKDLDYLLKESDILTVHLSLNEETYKFLNRERLSKMKRGAFLINTSRGAIVDEEALLEMLENGHLAGAALDVFEYEPPKSEVEKKLLRLDKIIATPHIGAQTKEAMEEEGKEVARIIIEFFKKVKI